MFFRVPRQDDAAKDPINGVPFCDTKFGTFPKEYNCSDYRYGIKWMKDDEIGNASSNAFIDLALRKNTGIRCNTEAGYANDCSSLIEAKDLNSDGSYTRNRYSGKEKRFETIFVFKTAKIHFY